MVLGVSAGIYGQEQAKSLLKPIDNRIIPKCDTVIIRGEEIGDYLNENGRKEIEIVGFAKSKKSDLEKGGSVIK